MPYWRITSKITAVTNPGQRDSLKASMDYDLSGRGLHIDDEHRPPRSYVDEDGNGVAEMDVKFLIESDARAVFNAQKGRSNNPHVKVEASLHFCPHGEAELYDCKTDPLAQFEEVEA